MISTPRLTGLLALAYALLGAAGLALAIPPSYASPIFPAAGLALGCALWFGPRALAGMGLGAILLNVAHPWLRGTLDLSSAAAAVAMSTGAMLQAGAGAWLVRRWQKEAWRTLERAQDVLGFLLLGGVSVGLLSASVGVAALHLAGAVPQYQVLGSWWTWYVGDVLGILLFAPLTVCLLSWDDGLWRERWRLMTPPLVVILAVVVFAFTAAARWEKRETDDRIETDGRTIARRIADRLIAHREILSSLGHFIESMPGIGFTQFEHFTRLMLGDNPDLFALSFNDLLAEKQRLSFERGMSLTLGEPYQVTERDREGRLVRAARRPEYVPVRFIVPLAENRRAVGYDIHSEPIRRAAIARARRTMAMAVTAPVSLVQVDRKRTGVLQLWPVQDVWFKARPGQRLLGFAVAVLKIDEMIDIATRGWVPDGLVFQLLDAQAPVGHALVYRSDARPWDSAASAEVADWQSELRIGDRTWEFSVYVTDRYRQQHWSWMSWAVGVIGLILATLLQALMLGMTGQTAIIQRKNEALRASAGREQARAQEVEIGGRIQRILLREIPVRHLPGIQVAVLAHPSREVDGDFVDFNEWPGGLDILVGDVMGKGVPAALLGAATKNQFLRVRAGVYGENPEGAGWYEPAAVFNRIHRILTPDMIRLEAFATACLARVDLPERELRLVSAGHPRPIHFRAADGSARFLEADNVPLGILEAETYRQVAVPLAPGDVLVFYSDGLTEARSPAGAEFGPEALRALVAAHGRAYPQRLMDQIQQAVTAHVGPEAFADDLTCVVVRLDDDPGPVLAEATQTWLSDPQQLEDLRDFLQAFLRAHAPAAVPEEAEWAFVLAVNEAAANVMRHACKGDPTRPLRVRLALHPGRLRVHLTHRGAPFEVKAVEPPAFDGSRTSGFGLYLIDQGADEIRYLHTPEGEEIRLGILRADSPGAARA
jgi:serine phosphatase RsbU (regulator of sigma subunit)/CHASE1-domain containing sensor protein/anti-sigma regulatory factor (Ser/Thr protein kinase)